MRTAEFDFYLPSELIAQEPAPKRDDSRLLVLNRDKATLAHCQFCDLLQYLRPGDVLVLNNSRVIPARLRGKNSRTGGSFEILLLEENRVNDWWAMVKPGKRARVGNEIDLIDSLNRNALKATVSEVNAEGHRRLQFKCSGNIQDLLGDMGEVPLPPYIRRDPPARGTGVGTASADHADRQRYQTVFCDPPGSVAAPTAGLHFTPKLLDRIRAKGVETHFVTLHVGLGTFAPVKTERVEAHVMHSERYEISAATAAAITRAKAERRRVIAVGTTSVRALESTAASTSPTSELNLDPGSGRTNIFIRPPHKFAIVDALLTNFHLPRSTLLMLVSAFAAPGKTCGRELVLSAYAEAIRERYRFFSYGDAMLIV